MDQNIASGLTGLATSLNSYLGTEITARQTQANETHKSELAMKAEASKQEMELARQSALEAYKLTLEGKVDEETALTMHPKAGDLVGGFFLRNKRYPTVTEADKLLGNLNKDEDQKLKRADLNEQRMNRFIQKHTENLNNKRVPELVNAYNELADVFNTGKDVKGVGVVDSHIPNIFIGPEAARNRTNLQQIANSLLQQRSGAAVSDQEYRRFLLELQAGKIPSEKAIKQHLGKIGDDMKGIVGLYESGIPKDALEEYYNRPGAIKSADVKSINVNPASAGTTSKGTKYKVVK